MKHYAEVILESIDLELSRRNLFEKRVNYFMTSCNMDELLRCIKLGKIGSNLGYMPIDCRIILNSATEELSKRKPQMMATILTTQLIVRFTQKILRKILSTFLIVMMTSRMQYIKNVVVEEKSPYSSEDVYRGEDEGWIYED